MTSGVLLREGFLARRRLPVNYRPEDAALFEHERSKAIPPTRLVELRGVRASAEGMLFRGARVLPESFAAACMREAFQRSPQRVLRFLVKNYFFRRHRKYETPFLWVTDDWSNGYFHWVADVLPRIFAAGEVPRELVLLLPAQCASLEFVHASLRLFALGGVAFIGPREVRVCERLVMPTHTAPSGDYNEPLMSDLRDYILDRVGSGPERAAKRIYISRRGAWRRRIANEEEVLPVLRDFGFEVVHFERHSFEEQVRIAAGASVLVANHGAGMVNMLFMPPGGKVLELRVTGDRVHNAFFSLASAATLGYYYQNCAPVREGDDPHFGDVVVDVAELANNLRLMTG